MSLTYKDDNLLFINNKYLKAIVSIMAYFLIMFGLTDALSIIPTTIFKLDFYQRLLGLAKPGTFIYQNDYNYTISINVSYQYLIYVVVFLLLVIFAYNFIKDDLNDFIKNRHQNYKYIWISLLIYYITNIFVNILTIILQVIFESGAESLNQVAIESLLSPTNIYSYLYVVPIVIIGPFVEELVFRKCFFTLITNKYLALVISCVVFGLLHTISYDYTLSDLLITTLPYCFSGLAFSLCYLKTNNFTYSYLLHAGLNLFSFILIMGGF